MTLSHANTGTNYTVWAAKFVSVTAHGATKLEHKQLLLHGGSSEALGTCCIQGPSLAEGDHLRRHGWSGRPSVAAIHGRGGPPTARNIAVDCPGGRFWGAISCMTDQSYYIKDHLEISAMYYENN